MYREYGGCGSTTVPCFTKSCWTRMGWYVGALSWINIQESSAHLCGWVYQIVCQTQCSTSIYLSLFTLALLEMISVCMTSWLLKNIFRFTFPLELSCQHSILHGDFGDFNWFNLHLAMSDHPSWCYTGMWDRHPQVKWDSDICSLPWWCPSKWTENQVWRTWWHHQIINSGWHGSFHVILALLWQYNWWAK